MRAEATADAVLTPLISDPEISRHVTGLFLETAPGQLARLREAVQAGDWSAVSTTAHSLRGAMSHFRGARLEHLEQLEERTREGRIDNAADLAARAEADVTQLLAILRG